MASVKENIMSNPLFIIIVLIVGLIIILAIFRSASPFLNVGFGINAHIGDLRGSLELEAFDNQSQPTFAIFYADWCGHCKAAKPDFLKLKSQYNGNVAILLVNSDEQPDIVKAHKVNSFPTIRYYPNGLSSTYVDYTGARTYSDFVNYLGTVSGVPENFVGY